MPEIQFQMPSLQHVLGTDLFGRDVLSRALHGGRYTLLVAGLSTVLAAIPGVLLGVLATVRDHRLDDITLIIINALLALPGLLIALAILTVLGSGISSLIIALALAQVAPIAYTTRTVILVLNAESYIDAARNLGATSIHILMYYLLPNALPTLMAYASVTFSYIILNGAALTFLGVGIEPGIPEWGVMLAEGRDAFRTAPWIGLAPGIGITLTVWAVNALADELTRLQQS
jgi:peptide/nickel transport system permease protein